ncbi:hypothetical protein JRQ81_008521 [Phrynocephalus forsythii]|uniref:Glycosyltransferase family 92 protein n=1 Tax=Phrynocephalus forsythii TaxID=171643 RepID=A0A9Q0XB66_9SAUR|nr:hypothetical protein JRQ81_008521 [Phrynocephalus forsythii]
MQQPKGMSFFKMPYLKAVISVTIFTTILSFVYFQKRTTGVPQKTFCRSTPTTGTITPLEDNRTFIVAAYADKREKGSNIIRLIGIVHHRDVRELYCWFCCPLLKKIHISQADIDVHADRFEFPYGTTDVCCSEPKGCAPNYVSVHWSRHGEIDQMPQFEIKNRDTKGARMDFAVCISTMFGGFNNVLQLVQSIEMYKILGAEKVIIYKNNCSQLMEKVLEFYITEGTVEIIPWPINSYLNASPYWHHKREDRDIGYYGQMTALNDCLYRNMYKSKYVLLNDIDEIILPVKYPNWRSMMRDLRRQNPQSGVFLFENHIFPNTVVALNDPFNISSWDAIPGTNILRHVMKEPWTQAVFNQQKMIVDPRKVIQTSVHGVLKWYGSIIFVGSDVALMHHCRAPHLANLPRESLIEDMTLWRYNESLIRNVNRVLLHTML